MDVYRKAASASSVVALFTCSHVQPQLGHSACHPQKRRYGTIRLGISGCGWGLLLVYPCVPLQ